jgi:nitroimidazol reductase NimA-like FMN-containing flavoprotein (pyridoxamine 5'-phosphate oxidase superfamily)
MPKDYALDVTPANQQRRAEHAQSEAWARDFLARAQIGHVSTRWADQPFITPTTFWYDPARDTIFFHSNIVGRVRANAEAFEQVCFEASEFGRLLPANVALEFSIQYQSVIVFGRARVLDDLDAKRRVLSGLIAKYFPTMAAGREYRPITDGELKRTSVYAIAIDSLSGKKNWPERADQSDEWPPLGEAWFQPGGAGQGGGEAKLPDPKLD